MADYPTEQLHLAERYQLQALVARGGMSEIWRARDLANGGTVAIKRLLLDQDDGLRDEYRFRLLREADALRTLDHPNIIRYLDSGFDAEERPYLVLEWLEGEDLETRHRREPLDRDQQLEVMRQVLRGLTASHVRGVVHRDIKPSNIFLVLEQGRLVAKLIDFGVARQVDRLTRLTQTGVVMGTLYYLAPEQARGALEVDHRADIYALGVVLYELATGQLPFQAAEPVAVLLKIVSESPPWPRQLCPELPEWIEVLILRAMRRAPADRFQTTEQMLQALQARASPEPEVSGDATRRLQPPRPEKSMEQRLVSLLLVDADSGLEPEQQAAFDRSVQEAGGSFLSLLGGQLVGLFGLERTRGDETRRAVRVGLKLRREAGARLRMLAATIHVEVGRGLKLDTADLDRVGRALADLPPGELVLDRATGQLLGEEVQLRSEGPHTCVTAIWEAPQTARRVLGTRTPMVGRESELAGLQATFQRAQDNGEPEAALVLGPAGMGKSRLLLELMPGVERACALFLRGRTDSSRSGTPYSLMASALYRVAHLHLDQDEQTQRAQIQDLVEQFIKDPAQTREVATFVAAALGLGDDASAELQVARSDPEVMRRRVGEAFAALLAAAGQEGPVAICLEDLQWADSESMRLCEQLLDELEETPLFVLGTGRPEVLDQYPRLFSSVEGSQVPLGPLGKRAMGRLVRAVLGDRSAREVRDLVLERSDGNPYFAEELLSWMVVHQMLARSEDGWQLVREPQSEELPAGVQSAIQGRLDRLSGDLKELLKAASVFGDDFWEAGCQALGLADLPLALGRLQEAELVRPRGHSRIAGTPEWSFRQGLLRQVAYQMLPQERRRELHLRAAGWLEEVGEKDAAVLAFHFREGGDLVRAAVQFSRAGGRALAEGNLVQAVSCFQAALEDREVPAHVLAERSLGLASALYRAGSYEEAWQQVDNLDQAVGPQLSRTHRLETRVLRGKILLGRTRYVEAEQMLQRAADEVLDDADTERSFEIQHTLFWVIWVQGRYQDTHEVAQDLFRLARRSGRADQLCAAKLALAYYHIVDGDLSQSVTLAREAVQVAQQIRHLYREMDALMLLGSAQELAGQFEAAMATFQEAHVLAARLKSVFHLATVEHCQGRILAVQKQPEAAVERCNSAADRARNLGDDRTLATAMACEARARCLIEQPAALDQAWEQAGHALRLVEGRVPAVEAEARLARAVISLARGDRQESVTQALAAVALLDRLGPQEPYQIEILLTAYEALAAAGQQQQARELLQRAWVGLESRARRISDAELQRSFLEDVPHNARVAKLWQELG